MADQLPVFVGREAELAALQEAIARAEGQVILLVGDQGRGKTAILEQLNRKLASDPARFSLLYQLNSGDAADDFFDRLMGDFLRIGGLTKGKLVLGAPGQEKKWREFLGATGKLGGLPFLGEVAKKITCLADFLKIIVPDDKRPAREIFLDFLRLVARRLGGKRRLVLLLDPEKYLHESVGQDLHSLVRDLPDGITMIFAQRPDDCLPHSDLIVTPRVHRIPEEPLGLLPREKGDELIAEEWGQKKGWGKLAAAPPAELCGVLWEKYRGWPLPLTMVLADLPEEPGTLGELVAAAQKMPVELRDLLRDRYEKAAQGEEAVHLLQGLAILDRPATAHRVAALCGEGCTPAGLTAASHQPAVAKCLSRGEKGLLSLFHATMGECVLAQMPEEARQELHRRAAGLYGGDLEENRLDKEALDRLTYHAYYVGEAVAFLEAVDRIGPEKHRLRLLRSWERDLRWALPVCRELAKEDPGALEPDTATTLNNLGHVLRDLGERPEARQALGEALGIYRKLARADPAFEADVAAALNNLGNVLADLGERAEARQAYGEVLAIYRKLAQAEPGAFEAEVAMALNNLGDLLHHVGERAEARRALEEAVAIYRKLVAELAAFEPGLAMALNNLGNVLGGLGVQAEARRALEEALAIRQELAQREPGAFEPDVAMTLSNLGVALRNLGEWGEARRAFGEALAIYVRYAKEEPAAFAGYLEAVVGNALALTQETGERPEGWPALMEAQRVLAAVGR